MDASNNHQTNGTAAAARPSAHYGRRPLICRPDVLSTGEVAAILGVARSTAGKLIDRGEIRGHRISATGGTGDRRVRRGDLERFMVRQGMLAESEPLDVLAIGCDVVDPGRLAVVLAGSTFEAGSLVASRRPPVIVADLALGRLELVQIASAVRAIKGYDPILVAAYPPLAGAGEPEWARTLLPGFRVALPRPVRGADLATLLVWE